jgi:hypothetical protein
VTVSVGVCRSSINGHLILKAGRALARYSYRANFLM